MSDPEKKNFALLCDREDPLHEYRKQFLFPKRDGKPVLYFCGNSLGLQPRTVRAALLHELDQWATYGVDGHFEGELPWMYYHRFLQPQSAALVGAKEEEVVVMNTLTTNLHLMMVSFYRPTPTRYKILMEGGAFPSDQYAVESQVRFHAATASAQGGVARTPEETIIELQPREGEYTIRREDILAAIRTHADELALVMFGGVNYYTGQYFDIPTITKAAHEVGAVAGFDLAHTAGNVPLSLHDWGVDFAVWCSYKYLNSGPGGPSGVFVHERHAANQHLPRFAGWWGHDEAVRFEMRKGFVPMRGAAGWQLSNAQIFAFAAHKASLDIFQEVGMNALRAKSERLTGYLEHLLEDINTDGERFTIITPNNPEKRGAQLSLIFHSRGKAVFDYLMAHGAVCDWREPDVLRIAPMPLYTSFEDVWNLVRLIKNFFEQP